MDVVRRMICFLGYDYLFGCAPEPFYRGCVVRRVVHLRTVCKFFRKALGKKEAPHKLLELLGVPDIAAAMGRSAHLTVPSEDYPDIYAAVRAVHAFKDERVLGERPLEIRLLAGEHVIERDFTNRRGSTHQGLYLAGPAFSGVRICGAGIKETRLSGGVLDVEDTGGGAPFCLEGVTVTNPNGRSGHCRRQQPMLCAVDLLRDLRLRGHGCTLVGSRTSGACGLLGAPEWAQRSGCG